MIKAQPYYDNELADCFRFTAIEDRTAADNPSWGYLVLRAAGGEKKVSPQSVLHIFFLDELNPTNLLPDESTSNYALLLGELRQASQLNSKVASALAPFLARIETTATRLAQGQQLRGGRWITREDMAKEQADADSAKLLAMADEIRTQTDAAQSPDDINSAKATLASFASFQSSHQKVRVLKDQELASLQAALDIRAKKIAIDDALAEQHRKLERGGFATIKEFADAVATLKSLTLQQGSPSGDAKLLASSEAALANAERMLKEIHGWDSELGAFLLEVNRQADELGKLPVLALPVSNWNKNYAEFKTGQTTGGQADINELREAADRLFSKVNQYTELHNSSSLEKVYSTIQNIERFSTVLDTLPVLQSRLRELSQRYFKLIADAKMEESRRDFGAAQKIYQQAYALAPTDEILQKIDHMNSQNLGL